MSDLELAEEVARAAGDLLRGWYDRGDAAVTSSKSSSTDLVSQADEEGEELIRGRLLAARPDDGILGEEGSSLEGGSGRRWVVDPIDGTINFLFGIPQWCVSIGLEDGDGALCGVVYDPMRDELWAASRGGEATLNGERVQARAPEDLLHSLVATGFGYDPAVREAQAPVVAELLPRVRDIRRLGSAALDLCWVAGGRYDAYFERGVKPWDISAGALLCACAGVALREIPAAGVAPWGLLAAAPSIAEELAGIVGAT